MRVAPARWLTPLLALGAGCGGGGECQPLEMPGLLATAATSFHVAAYADTACDGPFTEAAASATVEAGQPLRLELKPGRYALLVSAFAGDGGAPIGVGCETVEVAGWGRPCISLALQRPDLGVRDQALEDAGPDDAGPCIGPGCASCERDEDCKDEGYRRCSPVRRRCVPCTAQNDDCPQGRYCAPDESCAPGCRRDGDCGEPGRSHCELVSHQCRECLDDGHCSGGRSCSPSGSCALGCDPGQGRTCPQGLLCCNRLCIDPQADGLNCGGCGKGCGSDATLCCGGRCVNPLDDLKNCGGCGKACGDLNGTASCDKGRCAWQCKPGFAHCDAKGSAGCETSITDDQNCGACGNRCNSEHATGTSCDGKSCRYVCQVGFGDCKTDAPNTDGCETDLGTDGDHCGGCGNACGAPNATDGKCVAGSCSYTCKADFGDCVKKGPNVDGCETVLNSTSHCGACGTACPAGANATAVCSQSPPKCSLACAAGFADCDNAGLNGCEVALVSDAKHCGTCGTACPGAANAVGACVGGSCTLSCSGSFRDCDKQPQNGCEINTATDVKHCGGCGLACAAAPGGVTACVGGKCGATCNPGLADCDKDPQNGCEVNTATDVKHCGACGASCPAVPNGSPTCVMGKCGLGPCGGALKDCDGSLQNGCEIDTATDVKHCGGCAMPCPAVANGLPACVAGKCGVGTCGGAFRDCDKAPANGCEIDTATDLRHCGACGGACPAAPANATVACQQGRCAITACAGAFRDCNGLFADGCETNTATSAGHCGACNQPCGAVPGGTAACSAGKCAVMCSAGFQNCNGQFMDGCEVNVLTSNSHCGACNSGCPIVAGGTTACGGGKCQLACNGGRYDCDGLLDSGCECSRPCCGKSCPVQHNNGLGQSYFDCAPLGVPGNAATYSEALASAARAAWSGQGMSIKGLCGAGATARCVAQQAVFSCAVWCYTNDGAAAEGKLAGRVQLNNVGNACLCPTPQSPAWN